MKYDKYRTWKEITQQPGLWLETYEIVRKSRESIKSFLDSIEMKHYKKHLNIIFSGSGSSKFVGEMIASFLNCRHRNYIKSVSSAEIVCNPKNYFNREEVIVLISLSRSGNSSESLAVVELANQCVSNVYHIFITCNPDGALARAAAKSGNVMMLLLPERSYEKGFTPTSSFSCMLLAGLMILTLENFERYETDIKLISDAIKSKHEEVVKTMEEIAALKTDRVVILGSSVLNGLAEEAALKVLELTSGQVSTSKDSFLSFRHGPKSIINDKTLVFCLIYVLGYTRKYECDLIKELASEKKKKTVVTLDVFNDDEMKKHSDKYITFNAEAFRGTDEILPAFVYLYFMQIYAFLKSVKFKINPDDPFPEGEVKRVVKGVNIYPMEEEGTI